MRDPDAPSAAETKSADETESAAEAESAQSDLTETTAALPEAASIGDVAPAPETTRARSSLPPFAIAIVAGAILAVGGAFGLRFFDGSTTTGGVLEERISALSARADSIESKTETSLAALRSALAAFESRVGAAERAAGKATSEANAALSEFQKTFAARLAALVRPPEGSHDGAAAETQAGLVDLGPFQARIDGIEQKLGSLEAALSAPKADGRAQQDREDAATAQGSKVQAIAIVAESLLRKLERGAPFSAELTALDNLGVGQGELAPLRPSADSGVASPRTLADQFTGLASPIIEVGAPHEEVSMIDRLQREAANLVRIRRIGEVDANDTDVRALVARIENALKRLDIEEAFAIWTELPGAAKAKSASWGEAAKARIDALAAARSIEADAVATLGKPKS